MRRLASTDQYVGSIIVAPIRWQGNTIGAIFLRTERAASPFSDADVRFCQVIASLTANALRNAHRFELLRHTRADSARSSRAMISGNSIGVRWRARGMTVSVDCGMPACRSRAISTGVA